MQVAWESRAKIIRRNGMNGHQCKRVLGVKSLEFSETRDRTRSNFQHALQGKKFVLDTDRK